MNQGVTSHVCHPDSDKSIESTLPHTVCIAQSPALLQCCTIELFNYCHNTVRKGDKTMLDDLAIALILTQREQQRLSNQAKRLSRCDMDVTQLSTLKQRWKLSLGYRMYAPTLLASLDDLIEQLQQDVNHKAGFDELAAQISTYNKSNWALLRQTYGSLNPYIDRWGKIHPHYRYAFEQTYEANAKLSVEDQAAWLHQLLPAMDNAETIDQNTRDIKTLLREECVPHPDIPPEKDELVYFGEDLPDDQSMVKPVSQGNVVDLQAYRRRKQQQV